MKKIIIVGSNHAAIAATAVLSKDPNISLTLYEQNAHLSFLGCLSPLCLGQQIPMGPDVFYTNEDDLRSSGATVHMSTYVEGIDFDSKIIHAVHHDGTHIQDPYDILILATGSTPTKIESHNVQTLKNFDDAQMIDNSFDHFSLKEVVIVGAGLIGLELAESAHKRNKDVILVEKNERILHKYFDSWISSDVQTLLNLNGIKSQLNTVLNDSHFSLVEDKYPHQVHIATIGVIPNTSLGQHALDLGPKNSYLVNKYSQTSRPEVYAIGDCASVYSTAVNDDVYCSLATHALHSGRIAAQHILGNMTEMGTQSSIGTTLFGYNIFATGANSVVATEAGLKVYTIDRKDTLLYDFMKTPVEYKITLVIEENTDRIVGAQLGSDGDISMLTHLYSFAIMKQSTLKDLETLDLFFHPQFNKLRSIINFTS